MTLLCIPNLDVARFDLAMMKAVEQAQVGFYFEEGGCWGMAEALFTQLQSRGLKSSLLWRPNGFVHAWVRLDGLDETHLDWRGKFTPAPGAQVLTSLESLRDVAGAVGGTRGEDYLSDVCLAEQVLQSAFALYDDPDFVD